MLTDRYIKNAKPGLHADEGGLYLQVHASGTKAFVHRSQGGGKQVKKVIGHYPEMGLAEARAVIKRWKSGGAVLTVREAWDRYYAHLAKHYADPEQTRRMFDKDVLPSCETKPVALMQKAEWTALVQAVVDRGSRVMANRLLSQIRLFLEYCEDQGWISDNFLVAAKRKNFGGKEVAGERNLSFEEIEAFLTLLVSDSHNTEKGTRWALYNCLITGQRSSEVLGFQMPKKDKFLTGDVKLTTDGPKKYKVPLTPHVRAALKFFDLEERPKDHRVLSHALRRLEQTFTPHNFRHTLSSRLADMKVSPHVTEKMLNHKMTGVMAIYNRADYWPERVEAQLLWGRKIASIRRKVLAARRKEKAEGAKLTSAN